MSSIKKMVSLFLMANAIMLSAKELNTFEKTLPDKLDFLIKLKQFVRLEKLMIK